MLRADGRCLKSEGGFADEFADDAWRLPAVGRKAESQAFTVFQRIVEVAFVELIGYKVQFVVGGFCQLLGGPTGISRAGEIEYHRVALLLNSAQVIDVLADGLGNAVALVAHNDDAISGEWLFVDVLSVEHGAIDGTLAVSEQLQQVAIYNMYVCDAAHGSLNDLGVIDVGGVGRAIDGVDAKPVGNADDGSYVAGVLNAVERERELLAVSC